MPRRIFIGDVQGCRVELERLLETVRYDPAADALHPVGDLVNRGPESLACLRLMRSLRAESVLGNHDLHLLHAAAGIRAPRPEDTFDDCLAADDRAELLSWLAAQPFARAFADVLLIHAGLSPKWKDAVATLRGADPLAPSRDALFAVKVRYCDPDGNLPARDDVDPGPPFRPWHALYDPSRHGNRTVVYGHWAQQGLFLRAKLRGLDSGCVWGGQLSAWIAEEDRVVQVNAERAYASIGS